MSMDADYYDKGVTHQRADKNESLLLDFSHMTWNKVTKASSPCHVAGVTIH